MEISADARTNMSQAKSPEEAYKIFAGYASKFIGDAIAKALGEALGATHRTIENHAIDGWQDFFNQGVALTINWGTPGYKLPPTIQNSFSSAIVNFGDENSPRSVSVGISIIATF
jgi:hypothetical protein